jgi:hypothetical protein
MCPKFSELSIRMGSRTTIIYAVLVKEEKLALSIIETRSVFIMSSSIPHNHRPDVGIVYSDAAGKSLESQNMAHYLCAVLASTGHAKIHLVPLSDRLPMISPRISFYPFTGSGKGVVQTVPASDYTLSNIVSLARMDVVIVVVNRPDSKTCWKILSNLQFDKDHNMAIFSLQRSLLQFVDTDSLEDQVSANKRLVVLDGFSAFAVVPHEQTGALVATSYDLPTIVIERLTKEQVDVASGPCNLLEYTGMRVLYRKNLTAHSWGVISMELLYVLNMFHGGMLNDTLFDSKWRIVFASMLRETALVLGKASQDGKWGARLDCLISLRLWDLEMLLASPTFLFFFLSFIMPFPFGVKLPSPGVVDLTTRRGSMTILNLEELVNLGDRLKKKTPLLSLLLFYLRKLERQGASHRSVREEASQAVDHLLRPKGAVPLSVIEWRVYAIRVITIVSIIATVYFLLFHGF